MHPGHIEEWFQFAKNSLQNESGWKVAAQRSQDTLCYQDCLGGRTVKFDFKEIYVPGIDEPAEAMMRPEARSQSHDCKNRQIKLGLQQIVAPGDAFVEQTSNFWILFMIACLFGESGLQTDSFFCGCKPTLARHQRRLDFPEEGDCAYANFQGHASGCQELMVIVRKASQRHHFRLMILFRVPDVELLLSWTSKSFVILLERSREAVCMFLSRFGIVDMRELDAKMYVVLGMRNFHRGPPLIPVESLSPSNAVEVAISCRNGRDDLKRWRRFSSEGDPKAFRMAKYLRCFMKQLGHPIMTHDTLDGRRLVSYQCVVLREDWLRLREVFWDAFRIQKAAYRRANGGKTAPTLQEDVTPHFLKAVLRDEGSDVPAIPSAGSDGDPYDRHLVVRKTFLEVVEENPSGCRDLKRSKSELRRSVAICG